MNKTITQEDAVFLKQLVSNRIQKYKFKVNKEVQAVKIKPLREHLIYLTELRAKLDFIINRERVYNPFTNQWSKKKAPGG